MRTLSSRTEDREIVGRAPITTKQFVQDFEAMFA
jgi:hypothetical protein